MGEMPANNTFWGNATGNGLWKGFDNSKFEPFNHWINTLVVPELLRDRIPETALFSKHTLETYARNLIAGQLVFYFVGGLWCLYIYKWHRAELFGDSKIPTMTTLREHVFVGSGAMFIYAMLPTFDDWLVENGYTMAYFSIEEVGG